jgi:hypothetical protein
MIPTIDHFGTLVLLVGRIAPGLQVLRVGERNTAQGFKSLTHNSYL